jgi:cyclic pyranopterin phosphate synthase
VLVVQVANELGIDRVRITGGEPLVRKDLPTLIQMIREQTTTKEISLTTNGLLLERFAPALKDAGLTRVNVSLHSLKAERFSRLTRFGSLEMVLRGIRAALELGLQPVKINALILKGFNDDEIEELLALTLKYPVCVRFLELMPIGEALSLDGVGSYLNLSEVRERLSQRYGLVAVDERGNGPARYWQVPGAPGKVGFITPISNKYCDSCSRLRLTATGELRPCLAYDLHISMRASIRRPRPGRHRESFLGGGADQARGTPLGGRATDPHGHVEVGRVIGMRVKLVFYGGLKRTIGAGEHELAVDSHELTVEELLDLLAERYPQVRGSLPSVACAIGARIVGRDHRVHDGDTVAILPPVSGG